MTNLTKLNRNITTTLAPLRGRKRHKLFVLLATERGTHARGFKPYHPEHPSLVTRLRDFVLSGKLPLGADPEAHPQSRQVLAASQEQVMRLERQLARENALAPL